jgi:hypothetical protein
VTSTGSVKFVTAEWKVESIWVTNPPVKATLTSARPSGCAAVTRSCRPCLTSIVSPLVLVMTIVGAVVSKGDSTRCSLHAATAAAITSQRSAVRRLGNIALQFAFITACPSLPLPGC